MFEVPRKRIKLEKTNSQELINDVKLKFEESQSYEIKHIEDKIQNSKHMQETTRVLKEQLQLDMDRKMKQLETEFASQIENLKGEKYEVDRQKALLLEERDSQILCIRKEMESKISELKVKYFFIPNNTMGFHIVESHRTSRPMSSLKITLLCS